MSTKQLLNDQWFFSKQALGQDIKKMQSSQVSFAPVDLPHDWLIYNAKDLYETSEGWYKRSLSKSTLNPDLRYSLRFEGVYMDSILYINGTVAGEWKYGYSTFEFDITDYLTQEDNEIMLKVVNQHPNSRWYSGAGIYRNVWLKSYPSTHLTADGIYISTEKKENDWQVHITTELTSVTKPCHNLTLQYLIYDKDYALVTNAKHNISFTEESACDEIMIPVTSPELWDISSPYLYTLEVNVFEDEQLIEQESNHFGFRTIEFTTDHGFFLNGKHVKLQGSCEHHDLGCLGSAMNKTALRRELSMLKEMGVNAIRTSHNMPAVELMELADEMGFLIDSEAFDMWERSKTAYDYARFFNIWVDKDVASWIRRDRNHPSVILWSIGNEIYDTHVDAHGLEITKRLTNLVHTHDYRHNAYVTIGSNYMPWEGAQKCADVVKVAGYNYTERLYEEQHKQHPDWMIYGSETSSTVQSRGIYHFPYSQSILTDVDEQCSCLGNTTTNWGAKNTEACIIDDRDAEMSAGQFIWTGFDYIGEPTPYDTKNSYFGQIDTAGFKKDTFYIYQAEWTDYKKAPMVHLFPYWDFNEGQLIDVRVCSNAPKVELYFNDESLGSYEIDHKHGTILTGNWQIPYQPGILKAVAYDEKHHVIATDIQQSFSDASEIILKPNKETMLANGEDLIFVEISMEDCNHVPVANANNRVEVTVSGAGRLVGLDNGDSTDYDQYKGTSRRLFSGKLLAVIAAKLTPGPITLTAASVGLPSKQLTLTALPSAHTPGISAQTENTKSEENDEIPIRKLEIVCPPDQILSKESPDMTADVILHPANATYQDVEWKITTLAGIDSNLALLTADRHHVTIHALGDGEVILRCTAKNGDKIPRIISQQHFEITGLGQAFIDPYKNVAAGLFTDSNCELKTVLDHGVATSNDYECQIGFAHVDFGSYGSDEVSLKIFTFENRPVTIAIYEGTTKDETKLLGSFIYDKPSIWNTYQPETYRLNRRLKGITDICVVTRDLMYFGGFSFTKYQKAYQKIDAVECDTIYGDTFTVAKDSINGIGNNVTLVFDEMDFTTGVSKITICGHSPIDQNSVHIKFTGEQGSVETLAEFAYSDDFTTHTYDVPNVTGMQKVSLVFLPGSNFDMKWIQFE